MAFKLLLYRRVWSFGYNQDQVFYTGTAGFSGLLFMYLQIVYMHYTESTASVYGVCTVPSKLYPIIMLFIFQVHMLLHSIWFVRCCCCCCCCCFLYFYNFPLYCSLFRYWFRLCLFGVILRAFWWGCCSLVALVTTYSFLLMVRLNDSL
jgi:hypothetical protein